jgi:hypothetical protein
MSIFLILGRKTRKKENGMKIKGKFFSKMLIDIFPHPNMYAIMLHFKITAN